MINASPKSEVSLFSERMMSLLPDDGAELDRIIWKMRAMAMQPKFAGNFSLRELLARGYLFRGDREAALPHLEAAYNLSFSANPDELVNLLVSVLSVGKFDYSTKIVSKMLESNLIEDIWEAEYNATLFALRSGDIQLLERIDEQHKSDLGFSHRVMKYFEEKEWTELFSKHQRIVESLISPYCSHFGAMLLFQDGSEPILSLRYFTSLESRDRLRLHRKVHDAIRQTFSTLNENLSPIGVVDIAISGVRISVAESVS
jgi:hypothetical protein